MSPYPVKARTYKARAFVNEYSRLSNVPVTNVAALSQHFC